MQAVKGETSQKQAQSLEVSGRRKGRQEYNLDANMMSSRYQRAAVRDAGLIKYFESSEDEDDEEAGDEDECEENKTTDNKKEVKKEEDVEEDKQESDDNDGEQGEEE